jgi:hypothetical protein
LGQIGPKPRTNFIHVGPCGSHFYRYPKIFVVGNGTTIDSSLHLVGGSAAAVLAIYYGGYWLALLYLVLSICGPNKSRPGAYEIDFAQVLSVPRIGHMSR